MAVYFSSPFPLIFDFSLCLNFTNHVRPFISLSMVQLFTGLHTFVINVSFSSRSGISQSTTLKAQSHSHARPRRVVYGRMHMTSQTLYVFLGTFRKNHV